MEFSRGHLRGLLIVAQLSRQVGERGGAVEWDLLLVLGCWLLDEQPLRFSLMSSDKSWLRRRLEKSLSRALFHAYKTVRVDPKRFLMELRAGHGLPVTSFQGMYCVEPPVLDTIAEKIIQSGMKV